MPQTGLEIYIKFRDEFSAGINSVQGKMKELEKTTQDNYREMRSLSRELRQAGSNMIFLGTAIIAPLALAFRNAGKYSTEIREELEKLGSATARLQTTIALNMLPSVEKLINLFNKFASIILNLPPSMQQLIVNGILVGGILTILSGILLRVSAAFVLLNSWIIKTVTSFLTLLIANPPLLAITAILAALITLAIVFRDKIGSALNIIEIWANRANIGLHNLAKGFYIVIEATARLAGNKDLASWAKIQLAEIDKTIAQLRANIEGISKTGEGGLSATFEGIKNKFKELRDIFTTPPDMSTWDAKMEEFITKQRTMVDQLRTQWDMWKNEQYSGDLAKMQAETEYLQLVLNTQQLAHQSFWTAIGKMKDTFASGISKMFVDMARGTMQAKEALIELGWQMVQILVDFMVQKVINFAVSKAFMAAETAASSAMAAILAAVWAPAAALVSLATLGANAAPAAAGIASIVGMTEAVAATAMARGAVGGVALAEGGIVTRPTYALIGERGPEAVIPLNDNRNMGVGSLYIENAYFRNDADVEDVFITISRMLEQRRRARI